MIFKIWQKWMHGRRSARMIQRDEEDYLERFFLLRLFGWNVYLHRLHRSDGPNLHDHPNDWGSLILKGGYIEYSIDGESKYWHAGSWRWRSAEVLHRLQAVYLSDGSLVETWTLFVAGPRRRDWGFVNQVDVLSPFNTVYKWEPALGHRASSANVRGFLFPRFP